MTVAAAAAAAKPARTALCIYHAKISSSMTVVEFKAIDAQKLHEAQMQQHLPTQYCEVCNRRHIQQEQEPADQTLCQNTRACAETPQA